MGEAIIARGQTAAKNVLDDVPVVGTHASILTRVIDNRGKPIANLNIRCKDGTRWYNYTTNETGYALFKCNSGAANITAMNYPTDNSFLIVDHSSTIMNLDAPVGTKNLVTIKLKKRDFNGNAYSNMENRAYFISANSSKYGGTRDIKFLDTNFVDVYLVGAGSVGLNDKSKYNYINSRFNVGYGGAGGALNIVNNFAIEINKIYNDYYIGIGGNNKGNAGGSTFGFGASANGAPSGNIGAGEGQFKGGDSNSPANYIQLMSSLFNNNNSAKGIGHGGYSYYSNNSWYNNSTYGNISNLSHHPGINNKETLVYAYSELNADNGVMNNSGWHAISKNTGLFNSYGYSSYGFGTGGVGGVVTYTTSYINFTYAGCTTTWGSKIYKFTDKNGVTCYTTSSHSEDSDNRPGMPGGRGCIFFTNFR